MGVSETFRLIAELPADQHLALVETALREPYLELQSAAFDALVDSERLNRPDLVIQRFAELLPEVRSRVTAHPQRFAGAAREEIVSASEVSRRAGYEAVAALEGFAALSLLARGLSDPSVLVRGRAAELLEELAQQYLYHLVSLRLHGDPDSRAFVEGHREAVLRALGDIFRAWPVHGRKVFLDLVIECDPETYPLVTDVILARRDLPAFAAFVTALASSATPNAIELLFRLYLDPRTRLREVAVEAMRTRRDATFAALIAETFARMPIIEFEMLARRVRDIPWWEAVEAARDLDPLAASKLIEFLAISGLDRETRDARILFFRGSRHPEVRLRVLSTLRSLSYAGLAPLASSLLQDPSDDVKLAAAREVVSLGVPDRARLLLPYVNSAQEELRDIATREVSSAGFNQYLRSFDALDPQAREKTARALAKVDAKITERLADELKSLDGNRRFKALQIIGFMEAGRNLHDVLVDLLKDPDRRVRATVLKIVRLSGSVEGMRHLLEALHDPDSRVRANAIEALEDGGEARTATLVAPFVADPDNRVRAAAGKALHAFGRPEGRTALEAMLRSPDERTRTSAAWAIGEAAFEGAADLLLAHGLSERSPAVQAKLAEAIERLGEKARERKGTRMRRA